MGTMDTEESAGEHRQSTSRPTAKEVALVEDATTSGGQAKAPRTSTAPPTPRVTSAEKTATTTTMVSTMTVTATSTVKATSPKTAAGTATGGRESLGSKHWGNPRRRRRQSFDGTIDRLTPRVSGLGSTSFAPRQRERSNSCSLPFSSTSRPVLATVTAVPSWVSTTRSPRRGEISKPAPAESHGGNVGVGDLRAAEVVPCAEEDSSSVGNDAGTNKSGKKLLPLHLQPLAGRCWYEGCGKISVFRCQRCRVAFYCSRAHQQNHWDRHRGDCKEGKGAPTPPLARLAVPPQRPKAVGWADSTPMPLDRVSPSPGWNGTPKGVGSGKGGGRRGRGRGRGVASASFRENRIRLEAAMASAHSTGGSSAATDGFDPSQVRTSRGGASWTVPTSNSGAGRASSVARDVGEGREGSVRGRGGGGTIGVGSSVGKVDGTASQLPPLGSTPLPPPPGPPPPAKIPPPASRPLVTSTASAATGTAPAAAAAAASTSASVPGYAAADVDILTEMGFDRARAVQALNVCNQSVERAAEWLLTTAFGDGIGDGIDAGGVAGVEEFGPHLPDGIQGHDGDGGGRSWLGAGTELKNVVGMTERGGVGPRNDDDDGDLITTADASDVGQGLDMSEFWSSDQMGGNMNGNGGDDGGSVGGGGGGGGAGGFGGAAWGTRGGGEGMLFGKLGGGSGAIGKSTAPEEDNEVGDDLVESHEDTVGGVQADVIILFRPATAIPATAHGKANLAAGEEADPLEGGAEKEVTAVGGREAVLTIVVRPLPSTAPASLDSGSSRGGTEHDRHDPSHQVEHVISFPWSQAEYLARRHETAQALRAASSTAVAAAAAAVGGEHEDFMASARSGDAWPGGRVEGVSGDDLQPLPPPPLSPSSPLRPSSRSYDDGAPCSPSWGQKSKVGGLIVSMMVSRLDGGFQVLAPEADRNECHGNPGGDDRSRGIEGLVVARTHERPRGRSLRKWDRRGGDTLGQRPPPPLPPPPGTASKWGSVDRELVQQPWQCQACTFLNEDPVFRSACEICNTSRPSTITVLGASGQQQQQQQQQQQHQQQQWGDNLGCVSSTQGTAAAAVPATAVATAMPLSSLAEGGGEGETPFAFADGSGGPWMDEAPSPRNSDYAAGVGGLTTVGVTTGVDALLGGGSNGDDDDDDGSVVDGILGGVSPRSGDDSAGTPAMGFQGF